MTSPLACKPRVGRPTLLVLLCFALLGTLQGQERRAASRPDHAILFVIDGLSYKVWDKLSIPTLRRLAREGALVEKDYLPPPAHPRAGTYAELHTSSIPNPIMMSGTVFITEETGYLQQCFPPSDVTAFVVNATAYTTLSSGYTFTHQQTGSDDESVAKALEFMRTVRPKFLRVHLQNPGSAGFECMTTDRNVGWRWNIWATDSPYRAAIERADSLLGVFVESLKGIGVLNKTAILIVGDHGQDDGGWHPLQLPDGAITTMVLWGAGIKDGVRIPYAEHIDIVPTICALMDVGPPKTSQGRVTREAMLEYGKAVPPRKYEMKELNEQLTTYNELATEVAYKILGLSSPQRGSLHYRLDQIKQNFHDIQRFTEWPKFDNLAELLRNNRAELNRLDDLLKDVNRSR